jgi:hypothetical protein
MTKVATSETTGNASPRMSAPTRARLVEALQAAREGDAVEAHRAEARWLHAWRVERGMADEQGRLALAGDALQVWRYLAAPRGEDERFGFAPLLPPQPGQTKRVALMTALRSAEVTGGVDLARRFLEEERAPFAGNALVGALMRAGVLREPCRVDDARLARELARLDPRRVEASVLVRLALTACGWTVDEAKAAVRALDRDDQADANRRRKA